MRRAALTMAGVFVAATALDWVTALYTRHTAAESNVAVLYAPLLTGLWWVTVRAVVTSRWMILPLLAAAILGTWVGIRWL